MNLLSLIALVYVLAGLLCFLFAVFAEGDWRVLLFAFFCWPVVAWYGLLMLIERLRA